MARLIDADKYPCQTCNVSYCNQNCEKFVDWFNKTMDAVEVVRCKDCKYLYDGTDGYCCGNHSGLVRICENSFCSYGERRTNG